MILGWMHKRKGGFAGQKTGTYPRLPFAAGGGNSPFAFGLNLSCLCMRAAVTGAFVVLLAMIFALSAVPAWSNTAANTQIINQAQISFNDGTKTQIVFSSVAVKVTLVPSAPVVLKGSDQTTQYTGVDTQLNNTFTITATANGPDTYDLAPNLTGTNGNTLSAPSFGTILPSNPITLGASVVVVDGTHASTTTTLYVPSDGTADSVVNEIQADDWVVVGANSAVQVQSVSDPGGSGIATIILKTALGLGAPGAGTLVAEQKTVTVNVKSGTITTYGASIVITKTLTATSTSGSKPSTTSDTVTDTYTSGLVSFAKYVRNVTTSAAGTGTVYSYNSVNYYSDGVVANPGNILEYVLVAKSIGTGYVSSSVITDVLPSSYVSLKTGAYFGATDITYVNEAGVANYLTMSAQGSYVAPNLTVNVGTGATSSSGGTIASGKSVLILYQVIVNNIAQEDKVVNSAKLSSPDITSPATSAVTVTGVIRTKSTVEFLTYAPLLPGADTGQCVYNCVQTGKFFRIRLMILPAPVPVGTTTPINLSHPVPLTASPQIHQGEPIFIRLTDLDQNLNPLVRETVLVTISDTNNGDVDVLRLTETGPNTGIFAGYLPTSGGSADILQRQPFRQLRRYTLCPLR